MLKEVEEGPDWGQSYIAGLRRVVSCIFKILQERTDHSGIEVLQRKRRERRFEPLGGKLEQKLEPASIGIAGMLTGASLMCEGLAKECHDVGASGIISALRRGSPDLDRIGALRGFLPSGLSNACPPALTHACKPVDMGGRRTNLQDELTIG